MLMLRRRAAVIVSCLWFCAAAALAIDAAPGQLQPITLKDLPAYTPLVLKDLPDFTTECESKCTKTGKVHCNGLLATINYAEFKKCEAACKEEKLVLTPDMTGFSKPMEVRLFRQPGGATAPLAVTLLGFGQESSDKIARAWQCYLYSAGCHVLSFDSIVRNNMNSATGHGVAGNFVEETRIVCKLVDAALNQPLPGESGSLRNKTSGVRLLGASYGGLLALQALREPQAASWPIDRVLVVSTPVNMKMASERLDTFAREDKPHFGIMSLMKLLNGYTPKKETPTEEEEALMRAGIGYCFHGDLQSLAKSNIDRFYPDLKEKLKSWDEQREQKELRESVLKAIKAKHIEEEKGLEANRSIFAADEFERKKNELKQRHKVQLISAKRQPSDIEDWNFHDYVYLLLKPYWKLKRSEQISVGLKELLDGAPNFVQVVIAADDPLNDPKQVEELQKHAGPPRLLVLPHGGHLGFIGTNWMQALVQKMFKAAN